MRRELVWTGIWELQDESKDCGLPDAGSELIWVPTWLWLRVWTIWR
jgi:hypothetical protein